MSSGFRSKRWLVGVLGLFVLGLLAACATDADRARMEGVGAGALGGALLGAALGGNREGAAVGALLGGVIGAAVGDSVVNKKEQYAKAEDDLRTSAARARALAKASRENNEQLARDIAALDLSVKRLRNEKMSADSRRAALASNQERYNTTLASIDQQLQQMRVEIATQATVVKTEQARPKPAGTVTDSEGLRLVSASVRELQQQERSLELARLQLQQIDRRRAY